MGNKPERPWTVLPHSPLIQVDDNLWTVENVMPSKILRRLSIIKRADGSLLLFGAVPLDEATLTQVRALGKPEYLVLGHHQHMFDAHAFQEKLDLKTYGPKVVEAEIKKRMTLTGTLEDLPQDPAIECFSMPGSKAGETIILLKSGNGARMSILTSDVLQNNPAGKIPFYFRWMGFAGGPKVVGMYRMMFMSDRAAVKKTILEWAAMPNLKRLVPFHGDIVENGVADALKKAAATL